MTHLCKKSNIKQDTRRETLPTPILQTRMSKDNEPGNKQKTRGRQAASVPSSATGNVPSKRHPYPPRDPDDIAGMILESRLGRIAAHARRTIGTTKGKKFNGNTLREETDNSQKKTVTNAMTEYYVNALVPSDSVINACFADQKCLMSVEVRHTCRSRGAADARERKRRFGGAYPRITTGRYRGIMTALIKELTQGSKSRVQAYRSLMDERVNPWGSWNEIELALTKINNRNQEPPPKQNKQSRDSKRKRGDKDKQLGENERPNRKRMRPEDMPAHGDEMDEQDQLLMREEQEGEEYEKRHGNRKESHNPHSHSGQQRNLKRYDKHGRHESDRDNRRGDRKFGRHRRDQVSGSDRAGRNSPVADDESNEGGYSSCTDMNSQGRALAHGSGIRSQKRSRSKDSRKRGQSRSSSDDDTVYSDQVVSEVDSDDYSPEVNSPVVSEGEQPPGDEPTVAQIHASYKAAFEHAEAAKALADRKEQETHETCRTGREKEVRLQMESDKLAALACA